VKLGCVTSYLGLVMLASCISMMSAVALVLFSRASMTVVLRFVLWEMILMIPDSGLYLFMSVHGIIVIGSRVGIHCGSGFLPGITDDFVLDGASRVEGCMGWICVSSQGAVAASVGCVGARLSLAAQALWAVVFVCRMVSGAEAADGATIVCTGSVMVSELLAASTLVSGAGGEVLC
jgi:hypothetical protein